MSNFILNSNEDEKVIAQLKITEGYSFSPKKQISQYTKIKKVSLYDEEKIRIIIVRQYSKKYARLAKIIQDLIESDDATESDFMICLDEIEKLKSVLMYKYERLLKTQVYEYFLNDLFFLEKVIRERVIEYKTNSMFSVGGR